MSRQGMLAAAVLTALPMIGDYYTADLLSGAPRTSMIGNQIEFYLFRGSQKSAGASLVLILSALLLVFMYVLPALGRPRARRRRSSVRRSTDGCGTLGALACGGRTRGGGRCSSPRPRGCSSAGRSFRC